MSKTEIRLCSLLLKDFFGEVVQNVGTYLLKGGSKPLRIISRDTTISLCDTRKALCVLLQHSLVNFELREKGFVEYGVSKDNVLLLLRYTRYIYCAKTLYGDTAELLVEELLSSGQLTMSDAIQKVVLRLQEATGQSDKIPVEGIKDKFVSLAQTQFIIRCPCLIPPADGLKSEVPAFDISDETLYDETLYKIPEIKMHLILKKKKDDSKEPPSKRIKMEDQESQSQPDKGINWRINFERFHQYFRDQAIISAVTSRVNAKAGEIVQTMLRLSETKTNPTAPSTGPVAHFELLDALTKERDITEKELDPYLALLLEDEADIVSKIDDRGGGMYVINVQSTLKTLAEATAISIVQDRFGSKSCRIFRLLLKKHYLEQKQIEELAMIPAKDAKEMTYRMLQENIISAQEIPRTPDHAPSRTFFLFHVRMNSLCRMLLEWSYKAIYNAISRRSCEMKEHKRLLDKKQRVDAIISTLQQNETDPTQIQEIEEMISPPERSQLEKVKHTMDKLERSELQVDDTIFTLTSWLQFDRKV